MVAVSKQGPQGSVTQQGVASGSSSKPNTLPAPHCYSWFSWLGDEIKLFFFFLVSRHQPFLFTRILGSCTSLMQAIKVLVVASKDLQKEIVESGRVGRAVVSAPSPSARARIWFRCGLQWYSTTGRSAILRDISRTLWAVEGSWWLPLGSSQPVASRPNSQTPYSPTVETPLTLQI